MNNYDQILTEGFFNAFSDIPKDLFTKIHNKTQKYDNLKKEALKEYDIDEKKLRNVIIPYAKKYAKPFLKALLSMDKKELKKISSKYANALKKLLTFKLKNVPDGLAWLITVIIIENGFSILLTLALLPFIAGGMGADIAKKIIFSLMSIMVAPVVEETLKLITLKEKKDGTAIFLFVFSEMFQYVLIGSLAGWASLPVMIGIRLIAVILHYITSFNTAIGIESGNKSEEKIRFIFSMLIHAAYNFAATFLIPISVMK